MVEIVDADVDTSSLLRKLHYRFHNRRPIQPNIHQRALFNNLISIHNLTELLQPHRFPEPPHLLPRRQILMTRKHFPLNPIHPFPHNILKRSAIIVAPMSFELPHVKLMDFMAIVLPHVDLHLDEVVRGGIEGEGSVLSAFNEFYSHILDGSLFEVFFGEDLGDFLHEVFYFLVGLLGF